MQVPLEVTYRDVPRSPAIDSLVNEKVSKLEEVCDHINSCHIAIERPHKNPQGGSAYRVRIDLTVPPGHEIVADRNPDVGDHLDSLETVIRSAFDAARRQLVELNERQRGRVKTHEMQEASALVTKLFRDEGYGFLKTLDGQDIYFHRNSVLHNDFERLEIGTAVRFFLEEGDKGLQASTVQIVDKPGSRLSEIESEVIEPPLGWEP